MMMNNFEQWFVKQSFYGEMHYIHGEALFFKDNGVYRVLAVEMAHQAYKVKPCAVNLERPASPGEILLEYLDGVSITQAARCLGVSRTELSKVINGRIGISFVMATRLAKAFGTSEMFWLNLNAQYQLWQLRERHDEITKNVVVIVD